jgi:hypothetical protein
MCVAIVLYTLQFGPAERSWRNKMLYLNNENVDKEILINVSYIKNLCSTSFNISFRKCMLPFVHIAHNIAKTKQYKGHLSNAETWTMFKAYGEPLWWGLKHLQLPFTDMYMPIFIRASTKNKDKIKKYKKKRMINDEGVVSTKQ